MTRVSRFLPASTATLGVTALLVAGAAAPGFAAGSDQTLDLSAPGAVGNATVGAPFLPGWTLPSGVTQDAAVTTNSEFRISNGLGGPFFSHGGYVTPALGDVTAGETGVGDVNTFEYSFSVGSATGAYQPGLNIGLVAGNSDGGWGRYGGNLYLIHDANQLKLAGFWLDAALNSGVTETKDFTWTEAVYATLDPTANYDVRVVTHFVDGPSNDVIDVFVDDALVGSGTTFEGFAETTNRPAAHNPASVDRLNFSSGANNRSSAGIPLISSGTKVPALVGGGFLFSDVSYSAYQTYTAGPIPTEPPAVIAETPSATPDGPLSVPTEKPSAGSIITVSGSGFLPFENVYLAWYSTPVFAGWAQADIDGNLTAQVEVPASFAAGETHTVQAVGAQGERVLNAQVTLATAPVVVVPPVDPPVVVVPPVDPPVVVVPPVVTPPTVPLPTEPPAVIADAPSATPDGPVSVPTEKPTAGSSIIVTGSGFLPFENVYFVWYSTPVFAAWTQADADGNISARIDVPASFAAGETHTIQAVGAESGRVLNSSVTLAAAPAAVTPPAAVPAGSSLANTGADVTTVLSLASVLLVGSAVIVSLRLRSRRAQ